MKKNIMIIYGSKSTEHDISVLTALQAYNSINKKKYNVDLVYISNTGKWFIGNKLANIKTYTKFCSKKLKEVAILPCSDFLHIKKIFGFKKYKKIDCAILCLHGKNGEDGTVQGLLELSNIPYTSSGVIGSAIGLDKSIMKQIFSYNNVPIVKHIVLEKKDYYDKGFEIKNITSSIKLPLVVKPNSLGSSIGISYVSKAKELWDALDLAFIFDDKVIIEKAVKNLKEVNISVLGDSSFCEVSICEEVQNKGGLLSFEKKYLSNNCVKNTKKVIKNSKKYIKSDKNCKNIDKANQPKYIDCDVKLDNTKQNSDKKNECSSTKNGMQNLDRIIPANITLQQKREIEFLAKKIFNITNSKGVVRIDFMIDTKTDKVYANEINSIPGSLAFYLWGHCGLKFENLIDKMIDISLSEHNKKNELITKFNSSVLGQNNDINK